MVKDVGLLVNCGRWRLEKEPKCGSVMINFVFAVETLDSESSTAINELKEAVQETVAAWSRTKWQKMKKQEREQKAARKLLQNQRKKVKQ